MKQNLTNLRETTVDKVDSFYIVGSTTKGGLIDNNSNVKIDVKKAINSAIGDYQSGYDEGYEEGITAGRYDCVDLGLPSGTLWATRNVGAKSPEDYGDYFAWGETAPKDSYDWSNYVFGESDNITKYNYTDNKTVLELEDDAAHVVMGGAWHMPTKEQAEELLENTISEPSTVNGVHGVLMTSTINGNTIFFPFSGDVIATGEENVGLGNILWTSSLADDQNTAMWAKNMIGGPDFFEGYFGLRYIGATIRGVIGKIEEGTTCGLADALTKFCAWDSQDVGSGHITNFKPDAFLVMEDYDGIVRTDGYIPIEIPQNNLKKADGEDYYIVSRRTGGSNVGPVYFYKWDDFNTTYADVVYDINADSGAQQYYLYESNSNVNRTIIPLYEKDTIDTQSAGYFGELFIPQIRINETGVISSAKEYYSDYTQSNVTPTFTAVTLMAETQEDGETVQTMYYMWLPIYN